MKAVKVKASGFLSQTFFGTVRFENQKFMQHPLFSFARAKRYLSTFLIILTTMNTTGQTHIIPTKIGEIAVYISQVESAEIPVIFLHGVYFDHHLWDSQVDSITDRTTITVDMPLHGKSRTGILPNWTLDDCAEMPLELMDSLAIPRVIAVGQSWGSMTILRAAHKHPERFHSILFCNMPFQVSNKSKALFALQHSMLMFRNFYTQQAAKVMFGKQSRKADPTLVDQLKRTMKILLNREIKYVDKAVIMTAPDATQLIEQLKVKALAIKGIEDYVPVLPSNVETTIVKGGHVSPLEQPTEVLRLLRKLLDERVSG